jgi:ABC-type antimicrobial peptide transport system permease subunit
MLHSSQSQPNAVALFRTSLDPATLTRWIRREFTSADPTLPVTIEQLEERVGWFQERPRFVAMLVSLFAAFGLLLAGVGLYGVLSFLVTQQTRAIGVRMALGARPRDIAWRVERHAALWTAAGVVVGLGGSVVLARTVRGLLFGVSPGDLVSFGTAVALLAAIAAFAAWAPAHRAACVDPMVALRED